MKKLSFLFLLIIVVFSCKREDPQLGDAPTISDAEFTYSTSVTSVNVIVFTAANSDVIAKWDFGNETKGEGATAKGIYPSKGTYAVTLTVFTSGGSISNTKDVVIVNDDFTLLDNPIFTNLTGGISIGSKTWVIDSVADGHFGVGPNPSSAAAGDNPEWYSATGCEKLGCGMYNDRYTFHLAGFRFDMQTNGDVYLNSAQAGNFPGAFSAPASDLMAPYADQLNKGWSINDDGAVLLKLTSGAFIGYNTGTNEYKIVSLTENEMILRAVDAADNGLAWYMRLKPVGTLMGVCGAAPPPPPPTDSTDKYILPIDFELIDVNFTPFGNSTDTTVDNPDTTGVNLSKRVLETVHGNETWAGVFVDLKSQLDFSSNTEIAVKILAPNTGVLRIKLEDSNDGTIFIEKDVAVNAAQAWIEVKIDFAGEPSGTYDRLVFFPGWGVASAGTFYLDDIKQQ